MRTNPQTLPSLNKLTHRTHSRQSPSLPGPHEDQGFSASDSERDARRARRACILVEFQTLTSRTTLTMEERSSIFQHEDSETLKEAGGPVSAPT